MLESKREALTGLLVQLVGEQQKREDELMRRLVSVVFIRRTKSCKHSMLINKTERKTIMASREILFRDFHLSGTLSEIIDTEIEPSNAVC